MIVRHPRHAGSFYSASPEGLRAEIEWCFKHELGPGSIPKPSEGALDSIVALISPHAGYVYSGPIAAHGYYRLASDGTPDIVILLGPNHTGLGSALSIFNEGFWRTPLGDLSVDRETADAIVRRSGMIDLNPSAHRYEHSIEVQLPFIQFLYGDHPKIVPISFLVQDLEMSRNVGHAIAGSIGGKNAAIIASTDLTHYEPQAAANLKDRAVIEAILEMDEELLYETVEKRGISMCGYGPTMAALTAAKSLGANRSKLLCYKTSGDLTGDKSAVVGYASIALYH